LSGRQATQALSTFSKIFGLKELEDNTALEFDLCIVVPGLAGIVDRK
jgi:hypothetical protein